MLSTSELLNVWEHGRARPPVEWALMLLAVAYPQTAPEALAQLSIGQRDGRLLALREWTFGSQLTSLTTCPACGERLDLAFSVADIWTSEANPAELADSTQSPVELSLSMADYDIWFRLPNSLDMMAIANDADDSARQHALLNRCLLAAHHHGEQRSAETLPAEVIEAVATRMAQADPQADVQLALACPACAHQWQVPFDIISFFWAEINTWAQRILREVHMLASAYGWHEADILKMSPWRRQCYLAMVGQ